MAPRAAYVHGMDEKARQQLALFRISVLGPLVGARLEHGELVELCRVASERTWELPSGEAVDVSARTIEGWFYEYQRGGFAALHPRRRSDADQPRAISDELGQLILRLKLEKPRRSVRRIIRVLERAKKVERGTLTKSTVHRLLKVHGASRRPLLLSFSRYLATAACKASAAKAVPAARIRIAIAMAIRPTVDRMVTVRVPRDAGSRSPAATRSGWPKRGRHPRPSLTHAPETGGQAGSVMSISGAAGHHEPQVGALPGRRQAGVSR